MKVMKFGGTSIGDASRIRRVAEIIQSPKKSIVVLSAVAGTTDALIAINQSYKAQKIEQANFQIQQLKQQYLSLITELLEVDSLQEQALTFIEDEFNEMQKIAESNYSLAHEMYLLARGELLSTGLFMLYLKQQKIEAKMIPALDVIRLNENSEPDEIYLEKKLLEKLNEFPENHLWITQGYICRNSYGEIANLKRGGSDYSASLMAAACTADELQIWTDIDGMHNNDPRFVENTRSIAELSFDEAAELAYFGAKILHPASIKPARRKNIAVRLLDTLNPEAEGTLISSQTTQSRIKAIAAKDGITAIKIRSSEMLQAPGFLRKIFEVFELYGTSIDMITTSEVAVSVTIDDDTHLDDIINTLKEFGQVEVDQNLSIICVVGNFVVDAKGIASQVIQAVENIPLRMISYGGSPHNISILVKDSLKVQAINELHEGLFDDLR